MIDGIIKADGTSRLLRATLPATYEEFKAQAASGTLPIDVLFNEAGWSQIPTFLNKANLLKDDTASLFDLSANAVPDDVLRILSNALFNANGKPADINGNVIGVQIATGSYTGTGTSGASNPNSLTFDFVPKIVFISIDNAQIIKSSMFPYIWGAARTVVQNGDMTNIIVCSVSDKTLSWYASDYALQLNVSGAKYNYIAIG